MYGSSTKDEFITIPNINVVLSHPNPLRQPVIYISQWICIGEIVLLDIHRIN